MTPDDIPRTAWLIMLGVLGGIAKIVLNLLAIENRSDFYDRDFWLEVVAVVTIALPVCVLVGNYLLESDYTVSSSFAVAYLSAVVAKDILKQAASVGLSGIIAMFTRKP